jgi:hypothetical protein
MSPSAGPDLGEKLLVRRGRVDSVDLFEVKENELELLEQGSPASLQLNFAIFLISSGFSAVLTLTTATPKYPIFETVYIVVAVVGFLMGGYLLLSWKKSQRSIKAIIKAIRNRIPPEVLRAEAETAPGPALPANDPSPAR